jgi:hypothetical protein
MDPKIAIFSVLEKIKNYQKHCKVTRNDFKITEQILKEPKRISRTKTCNN